MERFLHIGIHKTGTTALQIFMWQNKDVLLRKHQLLYPKTGKPKLGHSFGQIEISLKISERQ